MKELKRLLPYLTRYKTKLIWGFIFVTISNVCSTTLPRIVGLTIDKIQYSTFTINDILLQILYLILLTISSGLFMYLTRQTIIVSSRLIENDLRNDFLFSIERQSADFFNKNPTGTLMAYATNDISAAREFLGPAIMYGANTITTFTFALYYMLSINLSITLLSLIPLPLIAITVYYIGNKIHYTFKDVQEEFANLTTLAQESFSGIRVIKAYNREDYESNIFSLKSQSYFHKNMKMAKLQSIMWPLLLILVGLAQIIVLGYGGLQVINNEATLGELTQFFIYLNLLIWPVGAIGWITNIIQRASASTSRLGKVFDAVPGMNYETKQAKFDDIKGDIEFVNVSLQYDKDRDEVLSGINLNIPAGSSLGIVGTVGSGKSSLLNLLSRLYDVTEGKILIDGVDIKDYPNNVLRSLVSVVPQEPFLFSMSIADNIKFSNSEATIENIINISKIAQLDSDINTFPEKYDTMLGERGITLSGGQKQRLAIARAILKNPSIIILDDALSAIDSHTEEMIMANIKDFMKSRTTLIISHRISTIKDADNIIVLEKGKIVEQGSHSELIAINGIYASLYNRQKLEEEIERL